MGIHVRSVLVGASCAVWLLASGSARAEAPAVSPMRLEYVRARGAEPCPKESFFRNVVAGHLGGRDPFTPATPAAAKRVVLTLRRAGRGYGAQFVLVDAAGKRLGSSTEVFDVNCTEVVESAGAVIVPWLLPVALPTAPAAPTPAVAAHAAEPEQAQAPKAEETAVPAAPPVEAPKPGVFEGKAGVARAVLYAITAAGLATGTGFAVASNAAASNARGLLATLEQNSGSSACNKTMAGPSSSCQQLTSLWQRRDTFANVGEGLLVAAGALGVATTISIWIPAAKAPALDVRPTAQGAPAGLTLAGAW